MYEVHIKKKKEKKNNNNNEIEPVASKICFNVLGYFRVFFPSAHPDLFVSRDVVSGPSAARAKKEKEKNVRSKPPAPAAADESC